MSNIPLALFASSLVIVPASVGTYYWATPKGTVQFTNTENPSDPIDLAPQPEVREEQTVPVNAYQSFTEQTKKQLQKIISAFPYDSIKKGTKGRTEQLENFVNATDTIRDQAKEVITQLLEKPENKPRDWKTIMEADLELTSILENDSSTWSKLAKIRKGEAEAQTDYDNPASRTLKSTDGENSTNDDIIKFCKEPKNPDNYLGIRAKSRAEREEENEYRFFTYYSYCFQDSFYLSNKLSFDPEVK